MIWHLGRGKPPEPAATFEEYSALAARARGERDFVPETGPEIHGDLFRYVQDNQGRGGGIIEVGCFRGGSSILFAYLCAKHGWPFYTLDVSKEYLGYTKALLETLGLRAEATFFLGTMQDFARDIRLAAPPLLVFIDGNHDYPEVVKDIDAAYRLDRRPYALGFHDFALRSHNPADGRIRVDRAIFDCFGDDVPYLRIGQQFGENPVPGAENPTAAGAYWEKNGSEGVIVEIHDRELVRAR